MKLNKIKATHAVRMLLIQSPGHPKSAGQHAVTVIAGGQYELRNLPG